MGIVICKKCGKVFEEDDKEGQRLHIVRDHNYRWTPITPLAFFTFKKD